MHQGGQDRTERWVKVGSRLGGVAKGVGGRAGQNGEVGWRCWAGRQEAGQRMMNEVLTHDRMIRDTNLLASVKQGAGQHCCKGQGRPGQGGEGQGREGQGRGKS